MVQMIAACHALGFFYLTFPDKLSNSFIQHIYTGNLFYIYKKLFVMKFKLHFMIFCIFMYKMTYKSDARQVFIPCYIHVSVNVYEAYVTKINHSLTYLLINIKDYVSISD